MSAAATREGPPLFVVGFPRSGTTMMRFLLNDHPDQSMPPETHFLDLYWSRYKDIDLSDPEARAPFWADFTASTGWARMGLDADAFCAAATPEAWSSWRSLFVAVLQAYADATGKPRIGEKTPDHYQYLDLLFAWFPDARVLFMIRDPRAVVASYLKVTWADGVSAYVLARRWDDHMHVAARWRGDERVHFVQYEHLVRDPEGQLGEILAFAQLRDERAVILDRGIADKSSYGSLNAHAKISDENIEAWRSRLSRRAIGLVEEINRSHMATFDYAPVVPAPASWVYLKAESLRLRSRRLLGPRRRPAEQAAPGG